MCGCGPLVPLGADSAVTRDEAVLGPDGGSLRVAGASLNIPPGALGSDTLVTLRRTDDEQWLPLHVQPLTASFEVSPARVALTGRPRLEIGYDEPQDTVVIVEETTQCDPHARDGWRPGTTIGNGTASFEVATFGRFTLGTVDADHCTSTAECFCEACDPSFCDGTSGACRLASTCQGECDCPGQ